MKRYEKKQASSQKKSTSTSSLSEKKQPNGRRKSVKYPALIKKYNVRNRHDLMDIDYLDKLSEDEKAWLNNFNEEVICAKPKKLYKSKKKKRELYNENNARQRDMYSRAKSDKKLVSIEQDINSKSEESESKKNFAPQVKRTTKTDAIEDAIIELIDSKKELLD